MTLYNSSTHFGLISRALHWITAALVMAQAPLGLVIADMQVNLSNLWLFGLHKTLGFVVLVLVLARIVWHRISPAPTPLGDLNSLPNRLVRIVHELLYFCLICIPLSGWIASSATGLDVVVFNHITLPAIAPVSETWEKTGFALHAILTRALMALLLAHIGGAVVRAVKRDGTMTRMIRG